MDKVVPKAHRTMALLHLKRHRDKPQRQELPPNRKRIKSPRSRKDLLSCLQIPRSAQSKNWRKFLISSASNVMIASRSPISLRELKNTKLKNLVDKREPMIAHNLIPAVAVERKALSSPLAKISHLDLNLIMSVLRLLQWALRKLVNRVWSNAIAKAVS